MTATILFLDFIIKALDYLSHKTIYDVLFRYNFNPYIINCITEWLTDRKQNVIPMGENSTLLNIILDVSRQSVLESLLFNIVFSTGPVTKRCWKNKYVDDCKIGFTVSVGDNYTEIKKYLSILSNWAKEFGFIFSTSKCSVVTWILYPIQFYCKIKY